MSGIEAASRGNFVGLREESRLGEPLEKGLRIGQHLCWIVVLIQSQKSGALGRIVDLVGDGGGTAISRRNNRIDILRPRNHRRDNQRENSNEKGPAAHRGHIGPKVQKRATCSSLRRFRARRKLSAHITFSVQRSMKSQSQSTPIPGEFGGCA